MKGIYIQDSYVVADFRCVGLDPALALMVHLSVTPATTVFEIITFELMNAEVEIVLTYMTLIVLFISSKICVFLWRLLARLTNNSAYEMIKTFV